MQAYSSVNRKAGYLATALVAIPLIFGGCRESQHIRIGTFRGFKGTVDQVTSFYRLRLEDTTATENPCLYAELPVRDTDYGTITKQAVPEGHQLERYANFDSLQVAYDEIMEHR